MDKENNDDIEIIEDYNEEDHYEGRIIQEGVIELGAFDPLEGLTPDEIAKVMGDFSPGGIAPMAVDDIRQSGNFTGGGTSQIYTKIYWSERETATAGQTKVIADLYFYTQYAWYGSALSGSYLSISGNRANLGGSVAVSGSGERKVMSYNITRTSPATITIAGGVQINGSYSGTYYGTIEASKNINLIGPPSLLSAIKTGGSTYSAIKEAHIKTSSSGYSKVKELWIKTSASAYSRVK